jgi:hypothetical protein
LRKGQRSEALQLRRQAEAKEERAEDRASVADELSERAERERREADLRRAAGTTFERRLLPRP